jgi:metal-dependent amidase/aminoacylase/carboxypeptidase family protein
MSLHGFKVTKHYLGLETAWRAEFTQGNGGRVAGVNSEMDALPGIGHGCGHNLIAISGVGVALAVKAALQAHKIPGKVILLGTPGMKFPVNNEKEVTDVVRTGEEGGGGKAILLERGGYKEMDFCLMSGFPLPTISLAYRIGVQVAPSFIATSNGSHWNFLGQARHHRRVPGPQVRRLLHGTPTIVSSLTCRSSAHSGMAPWEGINALDAAFLAYANVSALRQQIRPDERVHGIMEGKNWVPNSVFSDRSVLSIFTHSGQSFLITPR